MAAAAARDVGHGDEGGLAVGVNRVGEDAPVPDRFGLLQEVLEEGRVGQGPVGDAGADDEVVHGQRGGDQAGPVGHRGTAAEGGDADDMADAVGDERLDGGAGETGVGVLGGQRGVRGDEPEDGVRTLEGPVEDLGLRVRAGDHLDASARRVRKPGRIADDHPQLLACGGGRLQEPGEQLTADVTGGSSNDNHENLAGRADRDTPILRGATALPQWEHQQGVID